MTRLTRASLLGILIGLGFGLGGCQSLLPGDGPSRLALRQAPVVTSSGQRLGPDGYPLLGAFPNSAAAQIDNATVQTTRSGLQSAAATQNATASSAGAAYQSKLAELQAIKAKQRQDVAAATAAQPVAGGRTAADDPATVLRDIEGQR